MRLYFRRENDSASIRSPEPSPQGLTNDDEVGVQSVDGVSDSPYTSNVSCYSKDRVRAVIEAKRVHCTQPYGFACQPLRVLVTSPAKQASYHIYSGNDSGKAGELSCVLW